MRPGETDGTPFAGRDTLAATVDDGYDDIDEEHQHDLFSQHRTLEIEVTKSENEVSLMETLPKGSSIIDHDYVSLKKEGQILTSESCVEMAIS